MHVKAVSKVFDMIVSGLTTQAENANQDVEADEQETFTTHKENLEIYGFLLQWALTALEARAAEKQPAAPVSKGRKSKASAKGSSKSKAASAKAATWDPVAQVKQALDAMSKVLQVKLQRLFVTTSERDTMISLFTRPSYLVLESEQRAKDHEVKKRVFKVLCVAIKHHGHAFGAQTSVVQNLSYFEHLAEPMAEFLFTLNEHFNYPQLTDEILKELSNKEFNSNDTKGPKSISTFITKLSELSPRMVGKQIVLLIKFLDSEAHPLRCAVVEVCGSLINDLSKEDERGTDHEKQLDGYFDVLEERFLDLSPFVRSRTIQVLTKLCESDVKFSQRRQRIADLACRSLEDKSSLVRKNAVRLLTTMVKTHPFLPMHDGLLKLSDWRARLEQAQAAMDDLLPPAELQESMLGDQTVDTALLDEATRINDDEDDEDEEGDEDADKMDIDEPEKEAEKPDEPQPVPTQEQSASEEEINRYKLTKQYYSDAVKFIETLHEASGMIVQLLSSKTKAEVIEAMDFFCTIDAFKVETARDGTRKMLRLIWTKSTNDEGKGVQMHLIECYKTLFFDAPESFDENHSANYIARNMISLTFGTTPAELTSLEQLLSTMMKEGMVDDLVVQKLWQVYGVQKKDISRSQRRGAIIVLGMLALADPDIVVREMETILRIGLGAHGRNDLGLAKFSCVALRAINPPAGKQSKENTAQFSRLPNDHAILTKLAALFEVQTDSMEWFGLAEQAIGAIYTLAKHPDVLCSEIIRKKTRAVFSQADTPPPSDDDEEMTDDAPAPKKAPKISRSTALSQLFFIVGHVAIKQIVHIELIEMEFKRKKADAEKAKQAAASGKDNQKQEEQDELDLIGGTTEDDFTEAMQNIREKELLYGEHSLLAKFGPLVAEVCRNNMMYNDRSLQSAATLCMAKLMCVSGIYCEEQLPLLITIMEKSTDPITRSNVVIALGDMAVCFNHLIDENTDYLYGRLNDNDASVKRTCLMTLTFLILAGQVKVKGQLGEMAKCLEDSDKRIADLSRMFFSELATKDNAIYNQFVDMFSVLTSEEKLEQESFKRIIKFLATFIEKAS